MTLHRPLVLLIVAAPIVGFFGLAATPNPDPEMLERVLFGPRT